MFLCSCVSAARTTWKQAKKTYHSMVEYYLLRISETADYYGMTNCEEYKESMNNLSRQRLYNQLNEDILVYSSADYFFIFQDKYADIMMVESAKKKAKKKTQHFPKRLPIPAQTSSKAASASPATASSSLLFSFCTPDDNTNLLPEW